VKVVASTAVAVLLAVAFLPVVVAVAVSGGVAALPPGPPGQTTAADPAPTAAGEVALAWALAQVGKPYVWGAAGPDAFDCSGLALRAWAAAGVDLPRVAVDQYAAGAHVPVDDSAPGDLIFFATDPSDPSTIEHVGVSLGDGRMVDAPHTGAFVRVEAVWTDGLVGLATRP
jgi:cell wall-associated NlpC family hydrolase